jgi:hypothetical protein
VLPKRWREAAMMKNSTIRFQASIKIAIKSRIFADVSKPRRVKFGIARGIYFILNRRHDLQKEFGLWETELDKVFARSIRGNGVVYDIGGDQGHVALPLANLKYTTKVVSFEPDAAACNLFCQNIALNPSLRKKVEIIHAYVGSRGMRGSTPTIRIDDFVRTSSHPAPSFIKIDVDGAELDVLKGMKETIYGHRPVVVVETHSQDLELRCIDFFAQIPGYRLKVIRNARWRTFYPEWRPIEHNRWLLAEPICSS